MSGIAALALLEVLDGGVERGDEGAAGGCFSFAFHQSDEFAEGIGFVLEHLGLLIPVEVEGFDPLRVGRVRRVEDTSFSDEVDEFFDGCVEVDAAVLVF